MRRLIALIALLCSIAAARADDWAAPQVREVFSANRDWFVRVTPGESWGDTAGFAGAKKGKYASAEIFRRTGNAYIEAARRQLLNPVAPVEFFVSNDGRLVTLDNWHNVGIGAVIAIYAADGATVKSYTLANIFTEEEIASFPRSISSIHWHTQGADINADQKTFYLMIKSGDDLILGLETGRLAYCRTRGPSYLCRNADDAAKWRPHRDVAPAR